MAEVWGALSQSMPDATTLTDAYTCPLPKRATVEVVICNSGGTAATIRLSHGIEGAADTGAQYLLYDYEVAAGSSLVTARLTVKARDVIRVYASSASVAFNINGIEEDA